MLVPLLRFVGAHILNSNELINEIQRCQIPDKACYVSYDAIFLYTNIDRSAAIQSLVELVEDHCNEVETFGLSSNDIRALLRTALECNIFRFENEFYGQKRGLAVGIRIAPPLAIVYLNHIEEMALTAGILF
ncbi:hypothetical protein Y032_0439g1482 [Ancylostoma ceylanicum]|uniref:Reverse transcriptase domain-containing protein n=1 Tax=Ancylostoma ceylanicum TaxID=53326 RepID=A0A016X0Q2_9BILA|nr:hypothetical protein Y032_0439g1482 [Ancylostoma ceylanicum]